MPLCFPEKSTSGPDETAGMVGPPKLIGVEGMKGVETLGGIIPGTENKRSLHHTMNHIKRQKIYNNKDYMYLVIHTT